ncbi:MAG: hypothetical protein U9Q62_05225 [Campylobacterota bacterium]|nr:hypothetical protein [Campylobacterota bacterium]
MKLLKKLFKRYKKSNTESHYNAIIKELEKHKALLEKRLEKEKSDSKIKEHQKEYEAVRVLLNKSHKQLAKL